MQTIFCRKFASREARRRRNDGTINHCKAIVISEIVQYLRATALTCMRLARVCPDPATAHGLEEVAVDLMAKAAELADLLDSEE